MSITVTIENILRLASVLVLNWKEHWKALFTGLEGKALVSPLLV